MVSLTIRIEALQGIPEILPDLNLSPNWEFNFGAGVDVTNSGDHLILKCIVGRRFTWGRERKSAPSNEQAP